MRCGRARRRARVRGCLPGRGRRGRRRPQCLQPPLPPPQWLGPRRRPLRPRRGRRRLPLQRRRRRRPRVAQSGLRGPACRWGLNWRGGGMRDGPPYCESPCGAPPQMLPDAHAGGAPAGPHFHICCAPRRRSLVPPYHTVRSRPAPPSPFPAARRPVPAGACEDLQACLFGRRWAARRPAHHSQTPRIPACAAADPPPPLQRGNRRAGPAQAREHLAVRPPCRAAQANRQVLPLSASLRPTAQRGARRRRTGNLSSVAVAVPSPRRTGRRRAGASLGELGAVRPDQSACRRILRRRRLKKATK